MKDKVTLAYLCDGLDTKCCGHWNCYKNGGECRHTLDKTHALKKGDHVWYECEPGKYIEVG